MTQHTCSCGTPVTRPGQSCSACYARQRGAHVADPRPKTKSFPSPAPYEGYDIYGPRRENTGRWCVSLRNRSTLKQSTISVARYIMALGLGRIIEREFHVDHIDCNPEHDTWDNLQLLCQSLNGAKGDNALGIRTRQVVDFICPVCFKAVRRRDAKARRNKDKDDVGLLFCSKAHADAFNHLSRNYAFSSVVEEAEKINSKSYTVERAASLKEEPVGERILKPNQALLQVAPFFENKGRPIL